MRIKRFRPKGSLNPSIQVSTQWWQFIIWRSGEWEFQTLDQYKLGKVNW